MRSSVRALWLDVRASYWFIPSVLTVTAFFLALGTVHLDRVGATHWLKSFDWYEGSRPEGARAQLTVVAGAMIAVSSTVFAITISAVAFASGNYGPRLLTNFMNDRGNQVSLGIFIATFVYNLMLLRVVRNPQDTPAPDESRLQALTAFVPQLSMMVSAGSVFLSVGVLVYFLHHVPASIRINSVLSAIGRRLIRDIEKRYPCEGGADEPESSAAGYPLTADQVGYVEIIDFGTLDEVARDHGMEISLSIRTGDFVHPHRPLVETDRPELAPDLEKAIRSCFSLGEARTATQDLQFLIDELVEIALRALSPGVNDPFTAISSMHWLSAALAKLADRSLAEGPEQKSFDPDRVKPLADDFDHYVRRSFGALRSGAATNPLAAKLFLESLLAVSFGATSDKRRHALAVEAERLLSQAEARLNGPDLQEVRDRAEAVTRRLAAAAGAPGAGARCAAAPA